MATTHEVSTARPSRNRLRNVAGATAGLIGAWAFLASTHPADVSEGESLYAQHYTDTGDCLHDTNYDHSHGAKIQSVGPTEVIVTPAAPSARILHLVVKQEENLDGSPVDVLEPNMSYPETADILADNSCPSPSTR